MQADACIGLIVDRFPLHDDHPPRSDEIGEDLASILAHAHQFGQVLRAALQFVCCHVVSGRIHDLVARRSCTLERVRDEGRNAATSD